MNYVFCAVWVVCGLIAVYYLIRKEEFLDVSKVVLSLVVVCGGIISILIYFLCDHNTFKLNNPLFKSQ
jgi:fatty-acid desaturase